MSRQDVEQSRADACGDDRPLEVVREERQHAEQLQLPDPDNDRGRDDADRQRPRRLTSPGAVAFPLAYQAQPVEMAGEVSRIFMGVQIQCAQCHDHKTDAWKQRQFHEFAAFFAGMKQQRVAKAAPGQLPFTLRDGAAANEKEMREFCSQRLAPFKVPRKIVFLEQIPLGATGKLQRIGLAEKLGLA